MRLSSLAAGLVLALATAASATAAEFDLQGHRGTRGNAPENTIAAFEKALAIGVTTLEMDAAITADGVVVVSHDPALHPALTRDASGQWLKGRGCSRSRTCSPRPPRTGWTRSRKRSGPARRARPASRRAR